MLAFDLQGWHKVDASDVVTWDLASPAPRPTRVGRGCRMDLPTRHGPPWQPGCGHQKVHSRLEQRHSLVVKEGCTLQVEVLGDWGS